MGWLTGLIIGPYWLAMQAADKVKGWFGKKPMPVKESDFQGKPTDDTQSKTKPS